MLFKRLMVPGLIILLLTAYSVAAWAVTEVEVLPGEGMFRMHAPNQQGSWGHMTWRVDGNGINHINYDFKEYQGPYKMEGRIPGPGYCHSLIEVFDKLSEDAIVHYYTVPFYAPVDIGGQEIYAVDGRPVWKWKQTLSPENRGRVDSIESDNPRVLKFYKNVEVSGPGTKKVELWVNTYAQEGMWTAVLYTEDSATPYYLEVKPFMKYDLVYVPVRGVLDRLGAEVLWNPKEEAICLAANGNRVVLKPGEGSAVVNGREVKMDTPSEIRDGRTLLPLRFVAESLGYKVNWEPGAAFTNAQVVVSTP